MTELPLQKTPQITIEAYQEFIWAVFKDDIKNNPKDVHVYLWGKLFNELIELRHEYEIGNFGKLPDETGDVCWYFFNLLKVNNIKIDSTWSIISHKEYYILDNIDSCITSIGFSFGSILKDVFHGKPKDDQLIENTLRQIYILLNMVSNTCKVSNGNPFGLLNVITQNVNKLKERHGEKYNASFYKKG